MFLHLKLRNVKKHEDLDVAFTEGVNAIQGPNYRGKSTLLYGCLLAMFGPSPLPGKSTDIPRAGSNGRWYAGLTFAVDGRLLLVERTSSTATLKELPPAGMDAEPKLLASGAATVTAEIEKLIGMSAKRFCELRYAEQKRAEVLLTLGVGDVHKIIEEVGGVTIVNQVIKACSTRLTELDGKLEGLQVDPDVLTSQLEKVAGIEARPELAPEFLHTIASKRDGAGEKRRQIGELQAQQQELQGKAREFTDWAQQAARLEQAEGMRSAAFEDAETRLAEARTSYEKLAAGGRQAQLAESIAQLTADIEEGDRVVPALRRAESAVASARAVAARDEAALQAAHTQLAGTPETTPEAAAAAEEEVARLRDAVQANHREVEAVIQHLEGGVCGACHRPLDGVDAAHLQEMEAKKARLQAEAPKLRVAHTEATARAQKLRQEATQRAAREAKVAELVPQAEASVAALEEALQAHARVLMEVGLPGDTVADGLEAIVRRLRGERDQLKASADVIANACTTVEAASGALQAAEQALGQAKAAREAHLGRRPLPIDDLDAQLAGLGAQILDAQAKASALDGEANLLEQQRRSSMELLASERRLLDSYQARADEARQVAVEKMRFKALADYLRANRDRFVGELWDGIMAYAQNFASACTGGDIEAVKREADGTFSYTEGGHSFSVKGCASGAQKSIMGLGVQFALAELLPSSLQTVMLDEPSADMDAEHSAALTTLLRSTGKQIVLVSHRELDSAVADNVITL